MHQRAGRSASPVASRTLGASHDALSRGTDEMDEVDNDGNDDDLGFWGGESRGLVLGTTETSTDKKGEGKDDDDFDDLMDEDLLDDRGGRR